MRTWRPAVWGLAGVLLSSCLHAGVNRWTTQGPLTGYVDALAVDPASPDIVYAGTRLGGVFKSANAGAHWSSVSQGWTYFEGGFWPLALAIDPQTPSTIYAGTAGGGVWKSTDGGNTWRQRADGFDPVAKTVNGLAIDPSQPDTIYAATNNGVFRSVDAGCTWVSSNSGLPTNPTYFYTNTIQIDPADPATLYLGTFANSLFKSTNAGATWFPAGNGLPYTNVSTVVIDPVNSTHLFLADGFYIPDIGGGTGLVLESDDAAVSWHPASTSLPDGFYGSIAFDPASPLTVYAASRGLGVFRSDDGGATWFPKSAGLLDLRVGPLAVGPGQRLVAGTDGFGVFRSDDGAAHWAAVPTGFDAALTTGLSIGVSNPDVIFARGEFFLDGLARSADAGQTWQVVGNGLPRPSATYAVAVDPEDADVVYVSQPIADGGPWAFKSTNGGDTWTQITTSALYDRIYYFSFDPSDPQVVYAGGFLFHWSNDGGATWMTSSTPLNFPSPILARPGEPLITLSSPTSYTRYPYLSTDGGDTWILSATGLPDATATLAADPSDGSRLYAGTPGHGIYVSTDSGATWTPTGAPANITFGSIAVDPGDSTHLVATAQAYVPPDTTPPALVAYPPQGVLETRDGGATWAPLNRGLDPPALQALEVAFAPDGQTIYLATPQSIQDYSFSASPWPAPGLVTPSSGPSAGGTAVTVGGRAFQIGAVVSVGGNAATGVTVVDTASITATTPSGAAGAADVLVRNPDGQFETLPRGFVYDFDDVPAGSDFHSGVVRLAQAGVTAGCGGNNFCPADSLTRGQMAVFLEKALHGPDFDLPKPPIHLDDVLPCSPEGPFILQLASEGLTVGCGIDVFCPDAPNTRAQGAVFILKAVHGSAYEPPPATGTVFSDVPAGAFAADFIEQLAAEGLTVGCGGGLFCPDNPLTRGQAAAYIAQSLLAP